MGQHSVSCRTLIALISKLEENGVLKGGNVAGGSGRLYLPSTAAAGERKRTTCGQDFRIKGSCSSETSGEKPHGCMVEWTLSLYSNKTVGLVSPLWTVAFHRVIFHTLETGYFSTHLRWGN